MRLTSLLAGLPLLALSSTHPTPAKRALSENDINTLQLATYLEHLERALYTGGYENFTDAEYTSAGFPTGFREQVRVIADHENTHATELEKVLKSNGVTPVPVCTYKFPYNSPTSFVALANLLTTVGIGAYIGGGRFLTNNPDLLSTASSILAVEARHDTYLRTGLGASPFPTSYDTALTAAWAYNLAQPFIVECPQQLPIPVLPKLTVEPTPPPNLQPPTPAGATLTFLFDSKSFYVKPDSHGDLYVAFINQIAPPVFEKLQRTGEGSGTVPVPKGIGGVAFAVLTTFSGGLTPQQLSEFGTLAGPAEVALA